ncbi:SRPBCC family protein [Qipengyuania qiaonensis]|uniref:SRPBCC domain-containing protein n=1 Tax=Qipengyuania qiaonensis TaxID=2867240 RepID=A0ABS7J4A4_9SPHN|nr:SRPBCC domain-containing protein [Qipengyuania qiaonensis]
MKVEDTSLRSRELLSRWLPQPPDAVFEAWIIPASVAKWWGPEGYSAKVIAIEPRTGGRFEIEMRSADGEIDFMLGEIVRFERPFALDIRFHSHCNIGLPEGVCRQEEVTLMQLELTDERGGTRLRLWQAPFAAVYGEGAAASWGQALEKLSQNLFARGN